ncbi:Rv2175c family DNA-binding protein [Corynebacterium pseudodiphtheriticum]|uniref:Rv2175c family DNA-binding protein n=1 Tax=Corynebacterium pseudodiphtheriticum TaxID=37637 RepID=A0AAP4BR29_9CORY|nr:Rv2175c family DNA-binding protein [Corynebacterium pseudodiphtheriticum]MDC7087968.1 Rv2175c family DNA-binding protein [Corynebacterium pseudodiphtheriticum]MDK4228607.1 Rv2175c family DNA-binding protein [Corynebacterium pseudodiphtheriticum]MDK4241667.1 Rv2175c family DNA-binding protein [Corynebacterium pseudodiphtheriticum]MDK4307292.1 Rv2175c family DNA-binding protein [Corynebacterium pseudodiphtheriticum]MDK4321191.1 Rv2175c family DNA-binding protein [Corynebacterium pseudodiphthe
MLDNEEQLSEKALAQLLADDELLTLPQVAEKLGLRITRVHDLLSAKQIIAVELEGHRYVPAAFFNDKGAISKHVSGVITVLSDGGFSNSEIFAHLFTADETLPGRPIDALHGHLAREVIRRAQALAF